MGRPPSRENLPRYILDHTRHLLVQEGYDALSMRKIADEIGYSATTIYNYFAGKDGLFHALIEEGLEDLYNTLEEVSAAHEGDPVEQLRAVCSAYITYGLENSEYYEIMFMMRPERMKRYPAEKYRDARRKLEIFATILLDGKKAGLFEVHDARVASNTIWAFLHGVVSLLIARRVDVQIDPENFRETAARHLADSFVRVEPQLS